MNKTWKKLVIPFIGTYILVHVGAKGSSLSMMGLVHIGCGEKVEFYMSIFYMITTIIN